MGEGPLATVRGAAPPTTPPPSAPRQSSVASSSCSAPFIAFRSRLSPTKPVVLNSGATSQVAAYLNDLGRIEGRIVVLVARDLSPSPQAG
jgi:hypothetical protein